MGKILNKNKNRNQNKNFNKKKKRKFQISVIKVQENLKKLKIYSHVNKHHR